MPHTPANVPVICPPMASVAWMDDTNVRHIPPTMYGEVRPGYGQDDTIFHRKKSAIDRTEKEDWPP